MPGPSAAREGGVYRTLTRAREHAPRYRAACGHLSPAAELPAESPVSRVTEFRWSGTPDAYQGTIRGRRWATP
jgi:hypothetical protein